tara:strand:- start:247 stop:576 length:330 start_codon:yes stop_codon:yes gene_type:complete
MKNVKLFEEFVKGTEISEISSFDADRIENFGEEIWNYDPSDMWDDVENGKRYITIETEGMGGKAERELKAITKEKAPEYGFKFVKNYKEAEKLGIGGAFADDAILVYVG